MKSSSNHRKLIRDYIGKLSQTIARGNLWLIALGVVVFVTASLFSTWAIVHSGENFTHLVVRKAPEVEALVIEEVKFLSPWETTTNLIRDRYGIWRVPNGEKRLVSKVLVSISGPYFEAGRVLEYSQNDGPERVWHKSELHRLEGIDDEYELALPRRSSLLSRNYDSTINWKGDISLFLSAGFRALCPVLIYLLAILAVRKQRGQGLLSGWCQASTSTGDLNRSKAGARRSIHISIGSNVVAWTTIIFCLLIFLIFGLIEWPGLHWDASLFATPVLNVATGEGWIFGGLPLHLVSHISQTYNIHGILHVLVFGSLLQSSSWEKYFFWCGLINAATFLSWTLIFRRALERKGYPGLLRPILFGLMAGVIALGLQGRPEHMAPLLISLPLIMRQLHLPTRSVQLTEYALIGLLFTLSPASGVLYGMGVLLWISYNFENSNNPRFWRELAIAGLSSVTAVLIVIGLLSPLSIREWAENILMASGKALDFSSHLLSFDLGTLAGVSMSAPLWNVIVLTTGLCIFFLLVRRRMFVGLLAFAILIPYLYPRLTTYGYAPFFPLIFLIFISTNECSEISIFKSHGKNQAVNIGSVVAGFYTLVFVNMVALSLLYVFQGTSLLEARRKLDDLGIDNISKNQATVFNSIYRPSFIVFGNGGDRFIAGTQTHDEPRFDENLIKYEAKFRRKIEYFVYPQVYVGQPPDEVVVGADQFEIIYDGWKMESPRFFGVKFWGPMPMPGYQFSLYQRIKVPIH